MAPAIGYGEPAGLMSSGRADRRRGRLAHCRKSLHGAVYGTTSAVVTGHAVAISYDKGSGSHGDSCLRAQMARISSDSVIGSKGLEMTSMAPRARKRATSCG